MVLPWGEFWRTAGEPNHLSFPPLHSFPIPRLFIYLTTLLNKLQQ